MTKNILAYGLFSLLVIGFGGCAAVTGHGGTIKEFNSALSSDKCEFTEIDKKIEKDDDSIFWGIQGGSLARNCRDYNKSNSLFDKAEEKYKTDVDTDSALGNVGEGVGSVLVNNNVNDYEGNTYEKIMVNTYKGLNYLSIGDKDNARIEFNRALDRQRRAKEYFEKEIEAQKEKNKDNPDKVTANNKETQSTIYKEYQDIFEGYEAYPDFVNPFTTYISALYFMLDGDTEKARDLLKEVVGMSKDNPQIMSDFELSEKMASSIKGLNQKYAWIIYENGKGMQKDEINIHIPLFLVTSKVLYTGIALPKMQVREGSYEHLDVNGNQTAMVSNMDSVIKAEFEKRFPGIMTEAILSTVVKTVAQKQLSDNAGLAGAIIGALYQAATNKADVRSWTALPKNFQATRVDLVNGVPLVIKNDSGEELATFDLPSDKNVIIYVRSESRGNNKIHKIVF